MPQPASTARFRLSRLDRLHYANPNAEVLLYAPRSAAGALLTMLAVASILAYTAYVVVANETRPPTPVTKLLAAREQRGVFASVTPSDLLFDLNAPSYGYHVAYGFEELTSPPPCTESGTQSGWPSVRNVPGSVTPAGAPFRVPMCPVRRSRMSWMDGSTDENNAPAGFAIDLQMPLGSCAALPPTTSVFMIEYEEGPPLQISWGMIPNVCAYIGGNSLPLVTVTLALTQSIDTYGRLTGATAVESVGTRYIFSMTEAVNSGDWRASLAAPSNADLQSAGRARAIFLFRTSDELKQVTYVKLSALELLGIVGGTASLLLTVFTYLKRGVHAACGYDKSAPMLIERAHEADPPHEGGTGVEGVEKGQRNRSVAAATSVGNPVLDVV
jgi:hypothetical protein